MQKATFGKRNNEMAERYIENGDAPATRTFLYGYATFLVVGLLVSAVLLIA